MEKHYCINCGKEATELHHVVPLALGGNDIDSNKVWLCSECHTIIHGTDKEHRGTHWRELQRAGIEKAKAEGKYKGRRRIQIEDISNFKQEYNMYLSRKITKVQFAQDIGVSRPTLDKLLRENQLLNS